MIVGTAAYMAPEQAKGREADRRADVWAFGCVLFEMLTGRALFEGETVSEVLAGVLKTGPDWQQLPADTPESIRRLLRRCLERDPQKRLQQIGDARIEIDAASEATDSAEAHRRLISGERIGWLAGVLAAVVSSRLRTSPPPRELRLESAAGPAANPASMPLSPDGRAMAYEVTGRRHMQLWLRLLDSTSARPLNRTGGASSPFCDPATCHSVSGNSYG